MNAPYANAKMGPEDFSYEVLGLMARKTRARRVHGQEALSSKTVR